jgi:DNA modification methylase
MGSGTSAVAAIRQGRHWTGCELLQKHADRATMRIASEKRSAVTTDQLGLWTPDEKAVNL